MSTKYPGGFITKNYVAPTPSSASGIWTLDQQEQAQQAGIWPFGGPFNYIEDVFSTYLYKGNSPTGQSINNGIDISTKGGLIWFKGRDIAAGHSLYNTTSGITKYLATNTAFAEQSNGAGDRLTAFNTNGFSLGTDPGSVINNSSYNYASWTFRKQPKFFDVVTYTGNGTNGRAISHALGSVPGCIMVKSTSTATGWYVYHRSLGGTKILTLNTTDPESTNANYWNNTDPTSTVFSLGAASAVNGNGSTFVAYLFAHDAGGFGLTGTDNVISCGSYTGNGTAGNAVTLGFEPQWIMTKLASSAGGGWLIQDVMRGMSNTGSVALSAQSSNAETDYAVSTIIPTATGFTLPSYGGWNASGETYIYIAIRRGPMKVPTSGTTVFSPIAAVSGVQTTNFPVDMQILSLRDGASALLNHQVIDRLRGVSSTSTAQGYYLNTTSTNAESNANPYSSILMNNVGFQIGNNYAGGSGVFHSFQRAPGFMDVVCYTGTGSARTLTHNLGVAPQLMILKGRDATSANQWRVYDVFDGNDNYMALNTTAATASGYGDYWNSTTPTASAFYVGTSNSTNTGTYVNYLFATCAGVSKVGTYDGSGGTQTIDCGFTGGARFVLIKRRNSTGDWYVWDTARGMVSGTDPSLLLNTTAAEVNANSIYTIATGFQIVSTAAGINASGGTYLFLAIA